MHVERLSNDLLTVRVDDRERRIVVQRGPAEDVVSLGWELADDEALRAMRKHLEANGVSTGAGSAEAAALRDVQVVIQLRDSNSSALVREASNEKSRHVVMPLRL